MTGDGRRTALSPRGLLIFDLDGTLFQAHTVSIPATQETFQSFGLPPPPAEEIIPFFGRPGSAWHPWLRAQCPPALADQVVAEVDRREMALIASAGQLYSGVPEALAALRSMVERMAVCSNGPRDYVERVLQSQRLAGLFDVVRFRRPADRGKPQMVAGLLQCQSARPGIVIGDRGDDVAAAHENGLLAIGAAYGYGSPGELEAADALAGSPGDLPGIVRLLLSRPTAPARSR